MIDENTGLTEKETLFIAEYLNNGFNGTQAAIKAGYSEDSARQISTENLSKPHIREQIRKYLDDIIGKYKDTLEYEILKTYRIMAFYNPDDVITKDGRLKKDLKEFGDLSIVIKGIQTTYNAKGKRQVKILLQDRDSALEKLSQYLGILKEVKDLNIKGIKTLNIDYSKLTEEEAKRIYEDSHK